jgi:hypothetical protein
MISRESVGRATVVAGHRNLRISQLYVIGAIAAIVWHPKSIPMYVQLAVSSVCFLYLRWSVGKVRSNNDLLLEGIRDINDYLTIIFCLFLLCYYVFYEGYWLIVDFTWWHLVLVVFGLISAVTYWRNAILINVLFSNLRRSVNSETLDDDGQFLNVLKSHQIKIED